jgi:hypothetical protein
MTRAEIEEDLGYQKEELARLEVALVDPKNAGKTTDYLLALGDQRRSHR